MWHHFKQIYVEMLPEISFLFFKFNISNYEIHKQALFTSASREKRIFIYEDFHTIISILWENSYIHTATPNSYNHSVYYIYFLSKHFPNHFTSGFKTLKCFCDCWWWSFPRK